MYSRHMHYAVRYQTVFVWSYSTNDNLLNMNICLSQYFPLAVAFITESRFKMQNLIDFGGRYTYRDDRENTEYSRICSKQLDVTMREYFIKMGSILVSYSFCVIGPARAYILDGIKTTTTEMQMPFCGPKSNAEFMSNILLQTVIATHGLVCIIGMETLLTLLQGDVTVAPKLVESDLNQVIPLYGEKSISQCRTLLEDQTNCTSSYRRTQVKKKLRNK